MAAEGTYRRLVDAALAAGVVVSVTALVLVGTVDERPGGSSWTAVGEAALWPALMLGAGAIACALARRQPDNRLGPWLAGGSVLGALYPLADEYANWTLYASPGAARGGTIALLAANLALYSSWAILGAHVPLRFPTGRLLSPRWRWVSWLATASAAMCGVQIFHPAAFNDSEQLANLPGVNNPVGIPGFGPIASFVFGIGILALFAATFLAVGSLVVRYRLSHGVERDQLRWVAFTTAIVTVVTLVLANLANAVVQPWRGIALVVAAMTPMFLIVGIGVAVLRHQLFDIRVVIRRTLLYGSLAAFITITYVAVVVGIGRLVGAGGTDDFGVSIVATALVAAVFQPVRNRLDRLANRLVYGDVTSPYDLVTRLSRRITAAISPEETLTELAAVTAKGMRSHAVRVRLFLPAGMEQVVWPPDLEEADLEFPIVRGVVHSGEAVGEIAVEPRIDDPPGPVEMKMLADLASHAGVALKNLRLTGELQQKLVELQASRQRLVQAQTEERRRMERDIHDGAQQQLVAIRIKLGLAKSLLADDPPAVEELIGEVQAESAEALETLRDLARGLFPPTLAERGLVSAVRAHLEKTKLPVTVEDAGVEDARFDVSAEAGVYFCIREALQNASKHAPGLPLTVGFAREGEALAFWVADDGPGFDPATVVRGSGLQNMVDRMEALGGTLDFQTAPGRGTKVMGRVPGVLSRVGSTVAN